MSNKIQNSNAINEKDDKVVPFILAMKKDISDSELEEFLYKETLPFPDDYNDLLATLKYYRTGVSDSVLCLDNWIVANIVKRPNEDSIFRNLYSRAGNYKDKLIFTYIE